METQVSGCASLVDVDHKPLGAIRGQAILAASPVPEAARSASFRALKLILVNSQLTPNKGIQRDINKGAQSERRMR